MLVQEFYETRPDGVELIKTYSDIHHYIRQLETGNEYDIAIDVSPVRYTYEETDKEIPEEPEEREEQDGNV